MSVARSGLRANLPRAAGRAPALASAAAVSLTALCLTALAGGGFVSVHGVARPPSGAASWSIAVAGSSAGWGSPRAAGSPTSASAAAVQPPWERVELAADLEHGHAAGLDEPGATLLSLRDEQLLLLWRESRECLDSVSFGRANRGWLMNAVRMPESEDWTLIEPERAWGTRETVERLGAAIHEVRERYPASPALGIGQLSSEHGGYLRPHRSHQSGRDVDLGYYYRDQSRWYERATERNLDLPRTWALLRALIEGGGVEYVFIDRSIQVLLERQARLEGVDSEWLRILFEGDGHQQAIVRHTWGHITHMHIRFSSPIAVTLGDRLLSADYARVASDRARMERQSAAQQRSAAQRRVLDRPRR